MFNRWQTQAVFAFVLVVIGVALIVQHDSASSRYLGIALTVLSVSTALRAYRTHHFPDPTDRADEGDDGRR